MVERLAPGTLSEQLAGPASSRTESVKAALDLRSDTSESPGAEQRSPAAGPPASAPEPATLSEVATLLNAFRVLLLRHFIRRATPGASLDPDAAAGSPARPATTALFPPGVHLELMAKTPEEIAGNGALLQQLCSSVEVFAGLAAPATVSSIYLTSAFLRDETSSIASREATAAARRLRRWAMATAVLGLVFLLSP